MGSMCLFDAMNGTICIATALLEHCSAFCGLFKTIGIARALFGLF